MLKAVMRQASAMLSAPARRCRLMAVLRRVAMTCGPCRCARWSGPRRRSHRAPSATLFSMRQWSRSQARDHGGAGLFERQAADRVDDLAVRAPVAVTSAFAGDLDDLSGVGKSDSARGGEHFAGCGFGAAVAVRVVGGGDRDLRPRAGR